MGELNCAYCKSKDCGRAGHNYPIDSSFECFVAVSVGDCIRAYSDEELANFLSWISDRRTADGWLRWLQSPAGGEQNG